MTTNDELLTKLNAANGALADWMKAAQAAGDIEKERDELRSEVADMKAGIHEVMDKIRNGEVCDCDVLWFGPTTTLWERLDQIGGGDSCADCGGHDGQHKEECPIPW
ncbi:MAG TPA: hypothetical protein VM661_10010 [Candidatus Sulfotelmatobacter sp.]|jgi:hypothetical protein|nr:hypothetical protein [Candidatus Sulfotelmatobacter sp.]